VSVDVEDLQGIVVDHLNHALVFMPCRSIFSPSSRPRDGRDFPSGLTPGEAGVKGGRNDPFRTRGKQGDEYGSELWGPVG